MMERRMKDSGIPWIGMIPEEWEVCIMSSVFKEVYNLNLDEKETHQLQFKMGTIISKNNGDSKYHPETVQGYNIVYPGVIMINGLNLSFDLNSQRVGLVKENGIITSTYLALGCKSQSSPAYFTYLLKAYDNLKVFHSWGKGLRATLSYSILKSEQIIIPQLSEQEAIAAWLDGKCGEIDELIEVEQMMIEELEAYRQATITEAVTRGLNPDAPMRQTGISWLPEIPAHWETITLRGLSKKFRKGNGITKEDLVENGDILCVRYGDLYTKFDFHVSNIQCRTNVDKIVSPVYGEYGDILFTCSGEDVDAIGKSAALLCSEPCLIGGDLIIMKHDQNPKFLGFSLSSEIAQKQKSYGKSKLKVVHTSVKDLKNVIIALPSIDEQEKIVDYLDGKCREIDELIAVKREKIETLKQYRQSIIFEAVTGKIQIN